MTSETIGMYGTMDENVKALRSHYALSDAIDYAERRITAEEEEARFKMASANAWRAVIRELKLCYDPDGR